MALLAGERGQAVSPWTPSCFTMDAALKVEVDINGSIPRDRMKKKSVAKKRDGPAVSVKKPPPAKVAPRPL